MNLIMNLSTLALISVKTPKQLDALDIQTYIFAAIASLLFLLIAAAIASMIKFEGGSKPSDPGKRRLWFWVLGILSFATFFLYNMFAVAPTIAPNLQSKFMTTNIISSVITLIVYIVLGFTLSKIMRTKKIGNWFPSKSN